MAELLRCGPAYSLPPCRDIFLEYYSIDTFKLTLERRSRGYKYKNVQYFLKSEIDRGRLDQLAESCYEFIAFTLKLKQDGPNKFSTKHLEIEVNIILRGYLFDLVSPGFYKEIVVNQVIIDELRRFLVMPSLAIDDIRLLTEKSLSMESEKLLDRIKKIPGYRYVKFRKSGNSIRMRYTQWDVVDMLVFNNQADPKHEEIDDQLEKASSPKVVAKKPRIDRDFIKSLPHLEKCIFIHFYLLEKEDKEIIDLCANKSHDGRLTVGRIAYRKRIIKKMLREWEKKHGR